MSGREMDDLGPGWRGPMQRESDAYYGDDDRDDEECDECEGTGVVQFDEQGDSYPCENCDGTGRVPFDDDEDDGREWDGFAE